MNVNVVIREAEVVDVRDNCYIVRTNDGTEYKMPPNVGGHLEIKNGQLVQVNPNEYLKLIVRPFESDETDLENQPVISNVSQHQDSQRDLPVDISDELVWKSTRNITEHDINATIMFLELRTSEKYEKLFSDKKSRKLQVWQKLAEELQQLGFAVGNGKDGAERCRQKYYNLQKMYLQQIKSSQTTGTGKQTLPKYYDLLEKLFGKQHNIHPTFVVDSFSGVSEPSAQCDARGNTDEAVGNEPPDEVPSPRSENLNTPSSSRASTPTSTRFDRSGLKKPKSNSDKMLNTIASMHKEMCETTERHFQSIQNLLKEQNEYKKEFLQILKDMNRKRKRSPTPE